MSPKKKKVVQFKQQDSDVSDKNDNEQNQNDQDEREEVDHEHVVEINAHHHGHNHNAVPSSSMASAAMINQGNDNTTTSDTSNNSNNSNNEQEELIWFKQEENWELTWPIWHMLPRHERKEMALKYGYNTIGEFEEYMSLKSAVGDSTSTTEKVGEQQLQKPYENHLIYNNSDDDNVNHVQQHEEHKQQLSLKKISKDLSDDDDEEDDSSSTSSSNNSQGAENLKVAELSINGTTETSANEQSDESTAGVILLMLPEELLHCIFEWLPIDVYGTLALLNSHWKSVTRTEFVYKRLCERTYLRQSKRKALHVSRFKNSYRLMLEQRPRVRTGGGVYVLKYAQVKKIQRDMWTEIPVGAVLETVYYRYCYFQEDGRVLYALTSRPPHEMFPRFWKMVIHNNNNKDDENEHHDKVAVWGTYQVQKNTVTVDATHPWHSVRMIMTIQDKNNMYGKFNALSFDKHWSSASANFDEYWSQDLVEYKVPHEVFRFVKDKRL